VFTARYGQSLCNRHVKELGLFYPQCFVTIKLPSDYATTIASQTCLQNPYVVPFRNTTRCSTAHKHRHTYRFTFCRWRLCERCELLTRETGTVKMFGHMANGSTCRESLDVHRTHQAATLRPEHRLSLESSHALLRSLQKHSYSLSQCMPL